MSKTEQQLTDREIADWNIALARFRYDAYSDARYTSENARLAAKYADEVRRLEEERVEKYGKFPKGIRPSMALSDVRAYEKDPTTPHRLWQPRRGLKGFWDRLF
ncbi:MAG TPA: hypothetical protein VF189_00755 [Patescibacteria group bacterium]